MKYIGNREYKIYIENNSVSINEDDLFQILSDMLNFNDWDFQEKLSRMIPESFEGCNCYHQYNKGYEDGLVSNENDYKLGYDSGFEDAIKEYHQEKSRNKSKSIGVIDSYGI